MSERYKHELSVAKDLAHEAGEIMLEHFGLEATATWKGDNTPLTIADTTINQHVIHRISREFPEHGVLGEEESYSADRANLWVVDPIDGTQPYSIGVPNSAFSLAYVKDGVPRVGVVCDPFQRRIYSAVKGRGAKLNDRPLDVNQGDQDLHYVVFGSRPALGFKSNGEVIELLEQHQPSIKWMNFRSFVYGAMLVATGNASGIIMGWPKPWDSAASKLIVEEAGGRVTDLNGDAVAYDDTSRGLLMSNGRHHDAILEFVQK